MVKINHRKNVDIFSAQKSPIKSILAKEKIATSHSTLHEAKYLHTKLCLDSPKDEVALNLGAIPLNQALLTATLSRCSITDKMLGENKCD